MCLRQAGLAFARERPRNLSCRNDTRKLRRAAKRIDGESASAQRPMQRQTSTAACASGRGKRSLFRNHRAVAFNHRPKRLRRRDRLHRGSCRLRPPPRRQRRRRDWSACGEPRGGFYMWCELPHHIDNKYLSRIGAEHSILLAPSSAFNPDAIPNRPAMRMNIAYVSDARFHRFMTDRRDPS